MEHRNCLNCAAETNNKFCANCGQKTDTHRISLKHFVLHDLLHGVWHFEKGILFTVKEIFKRPGQAALDYIGGKRIRYYNVFYLSLLLIGLNIVLMHYYRDIIKYEYKPEKHHEVLTFLSKNINFVLFGIVPFFAFNAKLIFRKLKLNIAEHFILGGINLAGILMLFFMIKLFDFMTKYSGVSFIHFLEIAAFLAMLAFPFWTYWNAAKRLYTFPGFIWRILLFYVLVLLQMGIALGVIISIISPDPNMKLDL